MPLLAPVTTAVRPRRSGTSWAVHRWLVMSCLRIIGMVVPVQPTIRDGHPVCRGGRMPRADAVRNRARVLDVAAQVFATEGLSVPVHEIARRAGVGTGTVS